MTYHLVNQFHSDGFSIFYISKYFVLDWRTVKKYLSMTEPEYEALTEKPFLQKKTVETFSLILHTLLPKMMYPCYQIFCIPICQKFCISIY